MIGKNLNMTQRHKVSNVQLYKKLSDVIKEIIVRV